MQLIIFSCSRRRPIIERAFAICGAILAVSVGQLFAQSEPGTQKTQPMARQSVTQNPFTDEALKREQEELVKLLGKDIEKGKGERGNAPIAKPTPTRRAKAKVVVRETQTNQYDGYLGGAAVSVSLKIFGNTRKVEGDLYFVRVPTRLYDLKGENVREGSFRLTLLNDSIPIGVAKLEKATDPSGVRWEGELRDADGKTYPFFLTRSFNVGRSSTGPKTVAEFNALTDYQFYTGSVNNRRGMVAKALFKLKFSPGKCSGFYYQQYPNGQTSSILRLDGENKPEHLRLRESDSEQGFSAVLELNKVPLELSPTKVAWKGTLTNIRDNNDVKDVEFSHPR